MYELFASEYGWSRAVCREMTFGQMHLYLCRMIQRKAREAGKPVDSDTDRPDTRSPSNLTSGNDFLKFMA